MLKYIMLHIQNYDKIASADYIVLLNKSKGKLMYKRIISTNVCR